MNYGALIDKRIVLLENKMTDRSVQCCVFSIYGSLSHKRVTSYQQLFLYYYYKKALFSFCSHLLGYGVLTPVMLGVSHFRNSILLLTSPKQLTRKHILAAPVRLSFKRLLMYAPVVKNRSAVHDMIHDVLNLQSR